MKKSFIIFSVLLITVFALPSSQTQAMQEKSIADNSYILFVNYMFDFNLSLTDYITFLDNGEVILQSYEEDITESSYTETSSRFTASIEGDANYLDTEIVGEKDYHFKFYFHGSKVMDPQLITGIGGFRIDDNNGDSGEYVPWLGFSFLGILDTGTPGSRSFSQEKDWIDIYNK